MKNTIKVLSFCVVMIVGMSFSVLANNSPKQVTNSMQNEYSFALKQGNIALSLLNLKCVGGMDACDNANNNLREAMIAATVACVENDFSSEQCADGIKKAQAATKVAVLTCALQIKEGAVDSPNNAVLKRKDAEENSAS